MNQAPQDIALPTSPAAAQTPINLEQYWQEHISQWEQSTLSQSAYCRQERLIVHRWHYWHKKLTRSAVNKSAQRSELIPVKVIPQPMDEGLRVTLPNGITIAGVNAQTAPLLGAVLKQL